MQNQDAIGDEAVHQFPRHSMSSQKGTPSWSSTNCTVVIISVDGASKNPAASQFGASDRDGSIPINPRPETISQRACFQDGTACI